MMLNNRAEFMSNLTRKRKKRERINKMLDSLRTPKTCQQLEKDLGAERNYFTKQLVALFLTGHVVIVGRQWKANIWQAIKFDYREDDVDYEIEPTVLVRQGLQQSVYKHNPDHEHFKALYRQQSQQARSEYKSARVWPGVAEFI